jgi:hypothetical protein
VTPDHNLDQPTLCRLVLAICCLGVGCGDNIEPPPPCFGSNALVVVVRGEPPIAVMTKEATAWKDAIEQELAEGASTFLACVSNEYQIAVICDGDREAIYQRNSTFEESDTQTFFCSGTADPDSPLVRVDGMMRQAGAIFIGPNSVAGGVRDWRFSVDVTPATYDVLAVSDVRIDILRAVSIHEDVSLPIVDLDARGSDTLTEPIVVTDTNADTELSTELHLVTHNGTTARLRADAAVLRLPPPAIVRSDDRFSYTVSARDGGTPASPLQERSVSERYLAGIETVVLPPRLSPSVLPLDATFPLLLAQLPVVIGTTVTLQFEDADVVGRVTASPGWLSATEATELRLDQSDELPLAVRPRGRWRRSVSLSMATGSSGFSTSVQYQQ